MLWTLPGPTRWLQSLAAELGDGRSGIVFCPSPHVPEDLAHELESLVKRDVRAAEAWEFGDVSSARLVVHIRQWLSLQEASDVSVRGLASDAFLGRQTLVIDCRRSSLELQTRWLGFVAEFADACREMPRTTRPRLWVIAGPDGQELPHLPHSDVNLRVRWWWGVLSEMDVTLAALELGLDEDLVGQVAEIARWDLELLEALRGWDGSVNALSEQVGTSVATAAVRELATRPSRPQPPASLVGCWATGMVESWSGEISPHVRAELGWRDDAVASRLWLAQVSRYTPLIEIERWRLASLLDEELRRIPRHENWAEEDVTSLEIGPLRRCYLDHLHDSVPASRRRLLSELLEARNSLAHRRPLSPSAISSLHSLIRADR